ncbi:MAG: cobaltochelatase subunit CobN, partial [Pseudomonadota bacterium]|nr:cobaltochelatase subunit CobN [Pseudomonadota bacterium]
GLELDGVTALDDATVHKIQDYLLELKTEFIPFGLHAFGRLPTEEMRASTVDAIVAVDRSLLPDQKTVLADEMDQRIVASANDELDSLMRAMRGGYIKGASGGEPIRNPDAYPTGRNFYGIDPEKVPRKASWELGVKLADQMLAQHLAEHGEYPQKVSFVIWGDETMRHEGVLEAQIFHLLGTRPVWDARDKVVGVEVVPRSQLARPRVDIIIASAAEGMFNNVTMLMDEAVQKVKALEEAENFVRDHYLATKAALIDMGYSEVDADARAGVRIFDEPPGIHNLNTAGIAAASGTWDSDVGMANDYINKMGHGFGNGFWGEPMQDVFKLALDGVEKVVHSSSTTLYGGLDNDDFFMYMGGLAGAVRTVSGENPDLVVTNTRDPADPEMSSLDKFLATDLQTRYFNPRWIEGMQSEGYAGARTMVEFVEYLWGWDATVSEVVDDRMWQETFEVYVQDKHGMNMKEFFETESPYAFQDVAARMLETIRKEYWNTDDATRNELLTRYVDSVNTHGINCTEVSCGNARLMEYVLEQAQLAEIPQVSLDQFRAAVEAAIKGSIEQLADVQENFARSNDARIEAMYGTGPGSSELSGFRMEQISDKPAQQVQTASAPVNDRPAALLLQIAVLAMLALWWFRRRRQQAG